MLNHIDVIGLCDSSMSLALSDQKLRNYGLTLTLVRDVIASNNIYSASSALFLIAQTYGLHSPVIVIMLYF